MNDLGHCILLEVFYQEEDTNIYINVRKTLYFGT
jgi:hypothetical protein